MTVGAGRISCSSRHRGSAASPHHRRPPSEAAKSKEWDKIKNTVVEYHQWKQVDAPVGVSSDSGTGDGKPRKIVDKVKLPALLHEFIKIFKGCISEFVQHCFQWRWQAQQFKDMEAVLRQNPTHCVVAFDFSENLKPAEQTEVQFAYYNNQQIAILVVIVYKLAESDAGSSDHSNNADHTTSSLHQSDDTTDEEEEPVIEIEQYFFLSRDCKKGCEFVNTCILKLLSM
jgi:hypothetical protein